MLDHRATVHLDIEPHAARSAPAVEIRELPFDIVVMGDFSGRESRDALRADPLTGGLLAVDRDDLEAVLARLSPRVRLALAADAAPIELEFSGLDDFHPDQLLQRAPLFSTPHPHR